MESQSSTAGSMEIHPRDENHEEYRNDNVQENYPLHWTKHSKALRSMFRHLRNDESLSDVTLICQTSRSLAKFHSHRLILASRSRIFREMLDNSATENSKSILFLYNIEPEVIEKLLDFIYTGKADFTNPLDMEKITKLGKDFEISGLVEDEETDENHNKRIKFSLGQVKEEMADLTAVNWNVEEADQDDTGDDESDGDFQGTSQHQKQGIINLGHQFKGITQDGNQWRCLECGKYYLAKGSAQRHLKYDHNENPKAQCHICEKIFRNVGLLKNHLRQTHKLYSKGIKKERIDP